MSENNPNTQVPIWQKSSTGKLPSQEIMQFLAGHDIVLDRELLLFDIQATKAHIKALCTIDILTQEELHKLNECLNQLSVEFEQNTFVLDNRFEDCHSAIEWYLTDKLGSLGGKVHTGRSRNDQVMVAIRLYMRDRLNTLSSYSQAIAHACLKVAKNNSLVALPGYTHLQRAMPSSVGLWMAGMAEAFIDNLELIKSTQQWINSSPLGTASGFGINLPLARDIAAHELGFERLQINPQNVQNSRGKYELQVLQALSMCSLDIRRLAWDLSLYTSQEFAFVSLPDEYTTGSSIMPNKKNPDVIELLRACHSNIQGAITEMHGLLALPSSYHRDLQFTKAPLLRAFETGLLALSLVPALIENMDFNPQKMAAAITPELFATDVAVNEVKKGKTFRQAYQTAMQETEAMQAADINTSLEERVSPGATGNLMLDVLNQRLKTLSN